MSCDRLDVRFSLSLSLARSLSLSNATPRSYGDLVRYRGDGEGIHAAPLTLINAADMIGPLVFPALIVRGMLEISREVL
jgi:hypothetical protein